MGDGRIDRTWPRFAHVLSSCGATTVVAARRAERLHALVEEIEVKGGTAKAVAFDAADRDRLNRLFVTLRAEALTPTNLINATCVSRPGRAERIFVDDFAETVAVNSRAPWHLSQRCVRDWIETGVKGVIVNVASMLARRVGMCVPVYSLAEAALSHMTATQAREWAAHGIRVSALSPDYIRTEINDNFWNTEMGQRELQRVPLRRIGNPEDLDTALPFLVNPTSHFMNGSDIIVDDAQSWAL